MVDVQWAKRARADLQAILRYHTGFDPALALALIERIIAAGSFLAQLPEAGPVTIRGRRKWRVPKTPYLLFYRVETDRIRVLRVLHGARDLTGRQ